MKTQLALGALAMTCSVATATTFDIAAATGLFTPTFRGGGNTTWVGWDLFDDNGAGDTIINDQTPDVGTDGGSFVTTNGEVHLSGSLNYYSGGGSVSEDVTFDTDGFNGSGFTTVIVQAKTLFGGWGADIDFGPINGFLPSLVLQGTNATGAGQLFVKYELPGTTGSATFSMASGPFSFTSFDQFVVDTSWSPSGFAPDSAIETPEPSAAALAILAVVTASRTRRC